MPKDKLKFGVKYEIVDSGLRYDRTYLAKLEIPQGVYHCFAALTQKEHSLPVFRDGRPVPGEYNRFPDLFIVKSIKEGDFKVKGLEIIVKPKAKTILVGFEHLSCGNAPPRDGNAEMCLRLKKILGVK